MKPTTFSILGDSISTFQGYNPSENEIFYPLEGCDVLHKEHTWWHLFQKRLHLQLVMNESYSGSRISPTGDSPSSSFLDPRRQNRLQGEIIIVFGGTNDFGQAENPATLELFTQAYNRLIQEMLTLHKESQLYFCTPLQRLDMALDEKNVHGWSQNDLARTIREAVSKHPSTNLIDLASYPIIEGDGMLFDGLHPTRKGMHLIASLVEKGIQGGVSPRNL